MIFNKKDNNLRAIDKLTKKELKDLTEGFCKDCNKNLNDQWGNCEIYCKELNDYETGLLLDEIYIEEGFNV